MLEKNALKDDKVYEIVNNFYHSLVNSAKRQRWGRETHTSLIVNLFICIEHIIPQILKQYEGEEREIKMKGIAAQLRFTIEKIMPWKKFLEIANSDGMNEISKLLGDGEEVDSSILDGFLDYGREERGRTDYIL